ncbi:MAG TPA: FG-GAP-like repeat-containing protein, partial [Planctomycetaceae bacterium]
LVREARVARDARDLPRANELVRQALERSPEYVPALLMAAQAAAEAGDAETALDYYRRLPDEGGEELVAAYGEAGDLALRSGFASEAERYFLRVLREDPDNLTAHRRLAGLYVAEGRRWESAPHLWALIRFQRFSVEDLALIGNLDELYDGTEMLRFFERSAPDDPVPLTGLARVALFKSEVDKAEPLLRRVVAAAPEQIEAQANLGKLLADAGRTEEFLEWHADLPPAADSHPSIWAVRAAFAKGQGDAAGAIRCYWETIRRDPNHRVANYQLSHLLVGEGEESAAGLFAARAKGLEALAAVTYSVLMDGPNLDNFRKAAALTEELGRPWEAWGWNLAITVHFPAEASAREEVARLQRGLRPDTPRTLESANPALKVDLSRYPMPEWNRPGSRDDSPGSSPSPGAGEIVFVDLAAEAGLDFRYENGTSGSGMQIFQSVGGGVAVLDYDGDGWPDLYFPQAGSWPPKPPEEPYRDRLFRNLGDGRFRDVTDAAGLGDPGYGLGATVGDVNNDGWPDLYTANIGRNRLYLNNGDGTFADVTDAAGLRDELWTSSALAADLNGDGLPDLYDVNYCAGQEPFERVCVNEDAAGARTCKPTLFDAEPDRVFLNRGDGTFADATAEAGVVERDGRGLGIVAFDADGSGRLNLFVANDMTANLYWVNETSAPGGPPKFTERGVLSGLAFDFDGRPQACMGVAADDADGDGRLDLFVTNYFNESNTLYLQQGPELFVDGTRPSGLREPSLPMLGFGTQFLDGDLDGWPDLVVANGHIDDFTESGMPFRMRAQFFRNLGGRFEERPADAVGAYFGKERLGRGLARLDWDRDGRDDFAVSHLFEPVSLVTNRSPSAGRSLALRLVGAGARDAIGATVRVTAGGRTWTKQLTAGDGYQCSNERRLTF